MNENTVNLKAVAGGLGADAQAPAGRVPPHNLEVEMALLGAILANNQAYEKVAEFLKPEHFADGAHGRIFEAMIKLIDRGQIARPETLKGWLEHDGSFQEIGGNAFLARLATSAVGIVNAKDYGQIIYDLHVRRQLIAIGSDVVNDAYEMDLDHAPADQIESAESRLYELATVGEERKGFQSFGTALTQAVRTAEAAYKRDSHLTGVTTGLRDLDRKLGGLHRSDLLILAGRPSMGKTALATNIAFNAAKAHWESVGRVDEDGRPLPNDGAVVAFFSLEMSAEQLAGRLLSEQAEVSSDHIRRGILQDDEFDRLVTVSRDLNEVPLYIDDTPALTVAGLRARARRLQRTHGLGMIVIDYLQLMRGGGNHGDNRVQEISEITRGLKAIAKELNVPVLALSQLSRAVEQRDDKRPQLADLRESGSIEQDADVVMFIFREQYYLERAEPQRRPDEDESKYNDRFARWQERCEAAHNVAEVILAKQRHGPIGSVRLFFDGNFTRFADLALPDGSG